MLSSVATRLNRSDRKTVCMAIAHPVDIVLEGYVTEVKSCLDEAFMNCRETSGRNSRKSNWHGGEDGTISERQWWQGAVYQPGL